MADDNAPGASFIPSANDPSFTSGMYGGNEPAADSMSDSDALPSLDGEGGGDSFTQTTSVSWFEKLMEAAVGVLIGLVMVVATVAMLFWNEGRAVQTYKSLNEGAGLTVDVDPAKVDPANEGKLVHVQGELQTQSPVADPVLGVQARAARLIRRVEMYQWKEESHTETHKRVGGGEDRTTTYTYTRVWSDSRNNSERFHNQSGHVNPQMRFTKTEVAARDASLGAFRPGPEALGRLDAETVLPVEEADAVRLRSRPNMGPVQAADGALYFGQDAGNPRIGDLRVTYHVAPLGPVSFIGRQSGADLQEYQTKAGDKLLMARAGYVPASVMFAKAQADNVTLTWIIRAVATLFMWIAFFMILRPIAVVGDLVPFIGSMLAAGAGLVAFILTVALAPTVMAIAWLFYRPVVAIGILVAGFALAYGLRTLAHRARPVRQGPPGFLAGARA